MDKHQRQKLVHEILEFLNERKIRCTYGAVGEVIEVHPISVNGNLLGRKRPEASWIINSKTGKPTCYKKSQYHRDLFSTGKIIDSGFQLKKALDEWRKHRS